MTVYKNIKIDIPQSAKSIIDILQKNGYDAYVVGGCVRDSLLNRIPKDWDITTNAKPNEVIDIFKNEGFKVIETGIKHGTVTIMIDNEGYEITTYRIDGEYEDSRYPKEVTFTTSLKEDLARRDFTVNAIAYSEKEGLIDCFNGMSDLNNKIIRCVGNPIERFNEDALRMMRCIRFSSQLGFDIEQNTLEAVIELNNNIKNISKERIREELCKILISNKPQDGVCHLMQTGLISNIIPELISCLKFNQHNKHHDKDIFMHIMSVLENTPPKLEIRLSALLHDIGKPKCFTIGEDGQGHFLQHHKFSADMARDILTRLKFDNKTIDRVCILVYEHMSRYDKLRTTNTKKFINRVGVDNLDDLFELQIADIKGASNEYQDFSNVLKLKQECYKILNEKQPMTVKDLAINGKDLMNLGYKQGKEIGEILNKLLEIVLENPELNTKEYLIEYVKERVM
jgi:tRNA nucleotidyltransferase (CCA-adding enzyme)